jgi:hypothetical protein
VVADTLASRDKWVAFIPLALNARDRLDLLHARAVPLKFLIPGTVFLICFR